MRQPYGPAARGLQCPGVSGARETAARYARGGEAEWGAPAGWEPAQPSPLPPALSAGSRSRKPPARWAIWGSSEASAPRRPGEGGSRLPVTSGPGPGAPGGWPARGLVAFCTPRIWEEEEGSPRLLPDPGSEHHLSRAAAPSPPALPADPMGPGTPGSGTPRPAGLRSTRSEAVSADGTSKARSAPSRLVAARLCRLLAASPGGRGAAPQGGPGPSPPAGLPPSRQGWSSATHVPRG